ncbi:MAG: M23 family metallopeptidase [Prolixibacteraceae bacterium]|nr:M23 family metallopeptidase [Prolixibacteraceae bacterium]
MRIILIVQIIIFNLFTLHAQYINTDSLLIFPGFDEPVTICEYDSMLLIAPESELLPGDMFYYEHQSAKGKHLPELFSFPCKGKVISRFGPRSGRIHTGTDIKMNKGDTIYAAFNGVVTRARYYYGYGNMVAIDHGNNLETSYSHLSMILVSLGENVKKGEPVGLAGSTGRATTNHLHFEIREQNKPFDPELVYDFDNGTIRKEVAVTNNLTELHQMLKPAGYAGNDPAPQHYKVKYGDSLWKISRRFKTTVNSLCRLNNLNEKSVLRIGMVLKLY